MQPKVNINALTEEQFQALQQKITETLVMMFNKTTTEANAFLERFGLKVNVHWAVDTATEGTNKDALDSGSVAN
jgi:hypothetical protein